MFQEIWHKGDFEILKTKLVNKFPYSHYYYSGSIGSGLCLFSKWPIQQTFYHKFDPNGYAHKVQHGDWFGGKGVGMATINVDGLHVHVYVTHIHAEYDRENDEYLAHRVAQSFSLSQLVKLTSQSADLTLVCGDLNLEPVDLGYSLIRCNACLNDAWLEKKSSSTSNKEGLTCDCRSNNFCKNKVSAGKRIDYILYRAGKDCVVSVEECNVTMGTIPGKDFNYSDHEGVEAVIVMEKRQGAGQCQKPKGLSPLLEDSLQVINKGLNKTQANRRFFIIFAVISCILAYLVTIVHIPYPLDFFVTFFKVALVLATGFGVLQSLIMIRSEVHGLEAAREDIKKLLESSRD
ncbi:putative neutral sphingomyelinase isoform X2 [Dreissena polymorpha]|nr:putative neutral sphingomyelinase isoform X2 [Dreissena polymorpha]